MVDEKKAGKEYLLQYKKLIFSIERIKDNIQEMRERATKTTAFMEEIRVQQSRNIDKMADDVGAVIEMENYLSELLEKEAMMLKNIFSIFRLMEVDEQGVLVSRYLNCKEWPDIADEYDREIRWVYSLHGRALINFNQHLTSMAKDGIA